MYTVRAATTISLVFVLLVPRRDLRAEGATPVPKRESIIGWLRHQEELATTMYCEYHVRRLPTAAEARTLIEAECRRLGRPDDAQRYIYTPEMADAQCYSARWWRSGPKERSETLKHGAPLDKSVVPSRIVAFDGGIVRTLQASDQRLKGIISSIQNAHWMDTNRLQPYSLLYEFQNEKYSELVGAATEFSIRSAQLDEGEVDEGEVVELTFRHPAFQWGRFILSLDPRDGRLKRRDVISKLPDDERPRLYESHQFMDYSEHRDRSGEIILFPGKARYVYYMGTTPDGRHLPYTAQEIEITKVEFNIEVAESLFSLDFPQGTEIIDRLHDFGTISPVGAPTELQMTARRSAWHIVAAILAAIALGALVVWMRRRDAGSRKAS